MNRPIRIDSFADYQRWFGSLWPASTLSYAVDQYFEAGGQEAIVVRVINGGRQATIALPAGGAELLLQAVNPGSREILRASVDYDNIGGAEPDRFNLVIQRVRGRHSEYVEDQEIYTRLSVRQESSRYVATALLDSDLARVIRAVPAVRPDRTRSPGTTGAVGYVYNRSDGDDGRPLTDYDLIGSATDGTGLFALSSQQFNFLCLPPLTREVDIGAAVLLIAARFCRQQRAILLMDPKRSWRTVDQAIAGLRQLNFTSEDAALFFPRLLMHDKYRGREAEFAPCGVVAGTLARADGEDGFWREPWDVGVRLRGFGFACAVLPDEMLRLHSFGINPLPALRDRLRPPGLRVLGAPQGASADWRSLPVRRLVLHLLASIERGTRWVVFERNDESLRERVRLQVGDFLQELFEAGALQGRQADEAYFVICDRNINGDTELVDGTVNLIVGFATSAPGAFQAFQISHRIGSSSIRRIEAGGALAAAAHAPDGIQALRGTRP